MAARELTVDLPVPTPEDIEASLSVARWSVAGCGWKKLLPDLPDDVAALLAAPVLVSAESLRRAVADPSATAGGPVDEPAGTDADEDEEVERYPSPRDPCAASPVTYAPRPPQFVMPVPGTGGSVLTAAPPRTRRGRHRRSL